MPKTFRDWDLIEAQACRFLGALIPIKPLQVVLFYSTNPKNLKTLDLIRFRLRTPDLNSDFWDSLKLYCQGSLHPGASAHMSYGLNLGSEGPIGVYIGFLGGTY